MKCYFCVRMITEMFSTNDGAYIRYHCSKYNVNYWFSIVMNDIASYSFYYKNYTASFFYFDQPFFRLTTNSTDVKINNIILELEYHPKTLKRNFQLY